MNQSLHTFLASHGIGGCPGTLILAVDLKRRALRADYFYHQAGFLPATIRDKISATRSSEAEKPFRVSGKAILRVVDTRGVEAKPR